MNATLKNPPAPVKPGTEWMSHRDFSIEHPGHTPTGEDCDGTLFVRERCAVGLVVECSDDDCLFELTTTDDTFRWAMLSPAERGDEREERWWDR